MILHLAEDEKFIDHVIDVFEEAAPNRSIYYIQPAPGKKDLALVKSKHNNIIVTSADSDKFTKLINKLDSFDAVILHNAYNPYKQEIIRNAPDGIHFHWMCWGADLYCMPGLSKNLLLKDTKKYARKQYNFKGRTSNYLYENFYTAYTKAYRLKNKTQHPAIKYADLLKKVKSVSTVIPTDYDLIKRHISKYIKYMPFKYATLETMLHGHYETICYDDNFLVGNSASSTNNHLESFKVLNGANLNGTKIYVPISYGDRQYADFVEGEGIKILKGKCYPLKDFMPMDAYNKILNSCGNVVMNHTRQQAMGNIIMSVWKGARLFLNKNNPVYTYLKKEGFQIFEINEVKHYKTLSDFETLARHNRPLLKKLYNREQVLKETKELVAYLTASKQ